MHRGQRSGSDAERYEATVVSESAEEIRIRLDAIGSKTTDDFVKGHLVPLAAPVGNRIVVDDTSGKPVDQMSRDDW